MKGGVLSGLEKRRGKKSKKLRNRVIWEITELPGKPHPQGTTSTTQSHTHIHTLLTYREETQGGKKETVQGRRA